jgi:hypothetical protein
MQALRNVVTLKGDQGSLEDNVRHFHFSNKDSSFDIDEFPISGLGANHFISKCWTLSAFKAYLLPCEEHRATL